mgnify:FL=1
MKITRRQLKRILEVSLGLSASEIAAAKKKLKDEGGAAAADQVVDAVRQAESGDNDKNTSSQAIIDAVMEEDPDVITHEDGDIIDKSGIST